MSAHWSPEVKPLQVLLQRPLHLSRSFRRTLLRRGLQEPRVRRSRCRQPRQDLTMKVANIPVGSMRTNGSKVCAWLKKNSPDIVTLQKIGSKKDFPTTELRNLGYESSFLGWRSRSDLGVAVLTNSRRWQPEVLVPQLPGIARPESRFLTVNIGGIWVSSVYAPYNPEGWKRDQARKAIQLRVAWLNRLRDHVEDLGYHSRYSLLCGDFNVKVKADGPLTRNNPYYTEEEQRALGALSPGLGFVDVYRFAYPDPEKWPGHTWGYRARTPRGASRLHLILASESLARCRFRVSRNLDSRPREDAPPLVVEFDGVSL